MLFLVSPRTVLRTLPLLAVTAICAGCLVDNPAYDPSERNTRVDAAPAAPDLGVIIDSSVVIDADVVPVDTSAAFDVTNLETPRDVAIDVKVTDAGSVFCDPNDPALSLCLTFDGTVTDHSVNAIALTGQANFVAGIDGNAYEVSGGLGLNSKASAAFVSPKLTVDLWVRLSSFPETQIQALAVVPGVISVAVTGQGQVVCDVGVVRATSPTNMLKLHTWTGISCTYDGVGIYIYANGQIEAGRGELAIVPTVTASAISIGSASGFSPFSGYIDNLRFWRKRLTPSELCKISPECAQ